MTCGAYDMFIAYTFGCFTMGVIWIVYSLNNLEVKD